MSELDDAIARAIEICNDPKSTEPISGMLLEAQRNTLESMASRMHLIALTSFNIAMMSLLHPGKAIEIDKTTGEVRIA